MRCYLWAMLTVGLGLGAGCATAPAPVAARPEGARPLPLVVAKYERRLADGRLEVAAKLKNAGAAAVAAHVACDFEGSDGRPLAAAPEALGVSLAPGEVLTVHFDAATPAASEAVVFVKP